MSNRLSLAAAALLLAGAGCSAEVAPDPPGLLERSVDDTIPETTGRGLEPVVRVEVGDTVYEVTSFFACDAGLDAVAATGEASAPDGAARLVNVLYHDQRDDYGVVSLNVAVDDPADPSPDVEWFATIDFPVHQMSYDLEDGLTGTAVFTNGYRAGDGIAEVPGSFEVRCR